MPFEDKYFSPVVGVEISDEEGDLPEKETKDADADDRRDDQLASQSRLHVQDVA